MLRPALAFSLLITWFGATLLAAAPQPPRNLTAVVSGASATLTWQAPSSGSAPLGYLVDAALSPGGATIAQFLVLEPSLVLNAIPNGVYFVRVRAGNAEGISASSNEVVLSVPGGGSPCASPPGAPTSLRDNVSFSLVTLTWSAPIGCAATSYVVQAGSAPGLSDLAQIQIGPVTSFTISAPRGTYFVRVVALNAAGASVASNEVIVVVGSSTFELTGTWSVASDYINAPMTFYMWQRGDTVGGTYRDQKDFGGVAGTITGTNIVIDVNFGDTGIRFTGTIETENRIRGTIRVPVLGRTFNFEMTR